MKRCIYCGHLIDDNAKYCPFDGAPIPDNPEAVPIPVCKRCGTPVEKGMNFCPKCGTGICKKCGWPVEKEDNFCQHCGEPSFAPNECGDRTTINPPRAEKARERKFMPVLILALVSLLSIMAFPIINCESDWMDALSGGAATMTFWEALEKFGKYGLDVLDDVDVVIALTVLTASVAVFCGAGCHSKGTCIFFQGVQCCFCYSP